MQYELHVYINRLFGESENVNISQCVASCMASLQLQLAYNRST